MKCVVHGDDFTVLGLEPDLKWFAHEFAKHFETKVRGILGPDAGDTHEMRIPKPCREMDRRGPRI